VKSFVPPIEDYRFLLERVLGIEVALSVLEEAGRICTNRLQPLNRPGDEEGSRLVERAFKILGCWRGSVRFWAHRERAGLVSKLVWWVKLVAELRPGVVTETEVARIERDEQAGLADLGLRLVETKQLTAALQAEIVPAQVAVVGEQRRCCVSCGRLLASKGHYPVTFRSLFGDVPVRVRRLHACPCRGQGR
jgi:hypothetical protein